MSLRALEKHTNSRIVLFTRKNITALKTGSGLQETNAQALNPSIVLLFKGKPWDLYNSTTTSLSCYQDKMIRCMECAVHVLQTILHIESLSKLLWVHFSRVHEQPNVYIYLLFTRKNTTQCFASELIKRLSWKGQQTHFLDWCACCPTLDMV